MGRIYSLGVVHERAPRERSKVRQRPQSCLADLMKNKKVYDEKLKFVFRVMLLWCCWTCLFAQGLVYRGDYMVNWSPSLQTAVSDLEVEYSEEEGKLYYFK